MPKRWEKMCFSSRTWAKTAVLIIYEGEHTVKQIYIFLIIHLHFTRRSPFSRQKSSLNGLGTAQAEGSRCAHTHHQCRTRVACSAHVLNKWSPHSGCNRPGPPWPVCSTGSTHQLHQKTWLHLAFKNLPGSKALLSPPACSQSLSFCYSGWEGAAWPFALWDGLPPWSLPASRLSSSPWPLEAGRWDTGSGSHAVAKGNSVKLWASNLPWQKTYWLALLAATDRSYKSARTLISVGAAGTLR